MGSPPLMAPVVVVGDLVTDVVARLAERPVPGSDAAATVTVCGGGSGANTAAWLAAAGADATLVGRVGDDATGRERIAELAAAGVRPRLAMDSQRPTGTVVVLVAADGERTMFPDRGANLALQPADLPADLFAPGSHLHLSGYALLHPSPRAAGLHALELARAAGMTISVDPSSAQPLRRIGAERFLAWTASADLCLPNRDEAQVLTGAGDPAEAAAILAGSFRQTVVTLGAGGAVWSDGDQAFRCPAQAGEVVDTTGAGDAFSAGFLTAWLDAAAPVGALAAGCRLAARAVTVPGARPPQPATR